MDPDLNKLRHFVAVAEELNFTRGAERLGMSQQALSTSISRFEEELGVTLLDRNPRQVMLTVAGRSLLEDGRPLLAAWHATRDRARQIGREERRLVRVGRTPAVTGEEVVALLRPVQERHPDLDFVVDLSLPADLPGRALAGLVDLGFGRALERPAGLALEVIARQRLRVAISTEHPMADRKELRLEELRDDVLVVWSTNSPGTRLLLDICRRAGFEPDFVVDPLRGGPPASSISAPDRYALLTAPPGTGAAPGVVVLDFQPVTEVPLQLVWAEGNESLIVTELASGATPPGSVGAPRDLSRSPNAE